VKQTLEAFFLPAGEPASGERFCLFHPARGDVQRGCVVYVHPFAEEMNKSRRMAALQARALADAGFAVLQIDLHGCGDSTGDFSDASWDAWVCDVVLAARWVRERSGLPLWLWGLRGGALLAAEAARRLDGPCNFLFWQPALTGRPLLQQFIRLKAAASMVDGGAKAALDEVRRGLAQGRVVHIAGYGLAPALARGLESAELSAGKHPSRVAWFELSTRTDATPNPASASCIARWQAAGFEVHSDVVHGPAFWQTTEIEESPALISASVDALLQPVGV
jgi:exosortase A-associated hydrolase 2